jgi:hypothetical protein
MELGEEEEILDAIITFGVLTAVVVDSYILSYNAL